MPTKKRPTEKVKKESKVVKTMSNGLRRYLSLVIAFTLTILLIGFLLAPVILSFTLPGAFHLDTEDTFFYFFLGTAVIFWPLCFMLVSSRCGEFFINLWKFGFGMEDDY